MRLFDLIAVFIVMAAGFGYLNFRLLKLPTTIGLMALSLLFSLSLFVLGAFVPAVAQQTRSVIEQFDFNQVLLHGMLAFLLFAGALHIDLGDLARHKEPIALLATVGVLLSTLIVGVLMWGVFALLGFKLRFIDCLLFGALISPTDPIAVLSLLKKIGAPKTLEVQIAGESLFNDGIGVVLFMGLLEVATGGNDFDVGHFAFLFIREAVGGAVFGLAIGLVAYRMLKSVDNYQVEILLSLGIKMAVVILTGAPPASVLAFEIILNGTSMFNHGNVRYPQIIDSYLRLIVVTPEMHRVHHSTIRWETNSNLGFNFPWWDRIFGTYRSQPARGHLDMIIGLDQYKEPQKLTFFWLIALPFIGKLGKYPMTRSPGTE